MLDEVVKNLGIMHRTHNQEERKEAQAALIEFQKSLQGWSGAIQLLSSEELVVSLFAAQTLHIKVNRDLKQMTRDERNELQNFLETFLKRHLASAVKLKLLHALASLILQTNNSNLLALMQENVGLLPILPEIAERWLLEDQNQMLHRLRACSDWVKEWLKQTPLDEFWIEVAKGWSTYFDHIDHDLCARVKEVKSLEHLAELLSEWLKKKGTETILELLPSLEIITSEEDFGFITRMYGTFAEAHSSYLVIHNNEVFFQRLLRLSTVQRLEDPMLMCPIWEAWYYIADSVAEREEFINDYKNLFRSVLKAIISFARYNTSKEARRELTDVLDTCLRLLGSIVMLEVLEEGEFKDLSDYEARLWIANTVWEDLEEDSVPCKLLFGITVSSLPNTIHRLLLQLMSKCPAAANLEYIGKHLEGERLALEAANALDSLVEVKPEAINDAMDYLINLLHGSDFNVAEKLSIILTKAGQLDRLLIALKDLPNVWPCLIGCLRTSLKTSPALSHLLQARFDGIAAAFSALCMMIRCYQEPIDIASILTFSPPPDNSLAIIEVLCACLIHVPAMRPEVAGILLGMPLESDALNYVFDALTRIMSEYSPDVHFISMALSTLSEYPNPSLLRSVLRFFEQLKMRHSDLFSSVSADLLEILCGLLIRHLAPSQRDSIVKIFFELMRLVPHANQRLTQVIDRETANRLVSCRSLNDLKTLINRLGNKTV